MVTVGWVRTPSVADRGDLVDVLAAEGVLERDRVGDTDPAPLRVTVTSLLPMLLRFASAVWTVAGARVERDRAAVVWPLYVSVNVPVVWVTVTVWTSFVPPLPFVVMPTAGGVAGSCRSRSPVIWATFWCRR